MTRRLLSFIALAILAATAPAFVLILGVCLYAFVYRGVELIALMVFVDAYFMYSAALVPWYTVASTLLLIGIEFVKPYLLLYNQTE